MDGIGITYGINEERVMNRVNVIVDLARKNIAERLASGVITEARLAELGETLDMDVAEYVRFQEAKSLAVASGRLTLDEGQQIYDYLGESLGTFNRQPVHVKHALTSLFQELLADAVERRLDVAVRR